MPVSETQEHLFSLIWQGLLAQSGWEWFAVALGLAYIYLASKESIWCWPSAFFSTLIYTVLFWQGQLPLQAALNFYYLVMAVYGLWLWRHGNTQSDKSLVVKSASYFQLAAFFAAGTLLSLLVGLYLTESKQSAFPYLEAFVSVFSVLNTWLMIRKYLQTWVLWIFINSGAIWLYYLSGFYATIGLFTVYLFMAIYGHLEWKKSMRFSSTLPSSPAP